jgi:antitoxin (DNA-binding transcriptional repressor) of toxin-antitoxin stability system
VKSVGTHEAQTHWSALLEEVAKGETIVISRGRKLLAKLVPYEDPVPRPRVGEVLDAPFVIPDSAWRPMKGEELRSWGLQ